MRTGEEYRESLRDGRRIWLLGEGPIDDVTAHPATSPMVDEYAAWYDHHLDPAWRDVLMSEPGEDGASRPVAFVPPRSAADLRRLGRAVSAAHFLTAGNMTHTPGYGALIALGVLSVVKRLNRSSKEIAAAEAYRESIARTGRFLTFAAGGAPIGTRLEADPERRAAVRLMEESADGIVVSGKISMHTSTPFAEDLLITVQDELPPGSGRWLWIVVPINAPGVQVIARPPAPRHPNPFMAPLSSRFDELDAQLWMDGVFIPRDRVFDAEPVMAMHRQGMPSWLFWHQHYGWLARAEFTLGLALALADCMGLKDNPLTRAQLLDLLVDVQTGRSCVAAAELEPEMTAGGFAQPNQLHIAAASIHTIRARQRMSEILRSLPGSSLLNAPADSDLAAPEVAEGLEATFGGGGYSAAQRAALLQLAWDHVSSALDGRESAFELHANGGVHAWRERLRLWFEGYEDLANGVHRMLSVDMPRVDLTSWRTRPAAARRKVEPAPARPPTAKLPPQGSD